MGEGEGKGQLDMGFSHCWCGAEAEVGVRVDVLIDVQGRIYALAHVWACWEPCYSFSLSNLLLKTTDLTLEGQGRFFIFIF